MADQGAILVNGIAIKLNGINDPIYSLKGFLTGFKTTNGLKYVHLVENDVIKSNLEMFQNQISKGYYPEDGFLEYRKTSDISKLGKEYSFFVSAEVGDIINVKKIRLFSPFSVEHFGNWDHYTLTYAGSSLVNNKNEIVEPPIPFSPTIESMELNEIAIEFYTKNIYHVNTAITDIEKYERALTIAKIAIYIHNINAVLFPLFTITELVTLKNEQNTYWQTDVFTNPTFSDITNFFNSIYYFFRGAYLNQKRIQEAKGYEKAYWLALGMSSSALQSFTPLNKIALLSWMSQNVRIGQQWLFFNDNEGLILRIIESVTESQSDLFLNALFSYSETYYGNLFDRLADEKGFLSDNVIDDSTFGIGEDNRYNFIMSLYLVWQASSFNPYQNGIYSETNLDHFTYNKELGCNPDITNNIFVDVFDLEPLKLNFDAKPLSINYQSTSSGGYFIDNFYFRSTNIEGDTNIAHWDNVGTDIRDFSNLNEAPKNKVLAFQKEYRKDGKDGLYGTYDYLQSVSLIDVNQSAAIKIAVVNGTGGTSSDVNNLIPIFVLKYIDDRNLSSNIETTTSYLIDVASLWFGGTALISKFRYIRKISPFTNAIIGGEVSGSQIAIKLYITVATEAVNFTAASLSLYCKIITNPSNVQAPWLINMKEALMWVEIFSGVGSILAENMLKKKTKKLVDDFNTNDNWPIEFTTDPRGIEAKKTLNKIAGVVEDLSFLKTKIRQGLDKRILRESNTFTLNFTNYELDQLMNFGIDNNLPVHEIEGILFTSCRNSKPKDFTETSNRLLNWSHGIKPRGYSYKFNSLASQNEFGASIKARLDIRGIPSNDVRIQGSSLLTSNADDTDIGIFMDKSQIGEIKAFFKEAYSKKWVDSEGKLMKKEIEKEMFKLDESIKKGKIGSNEFGKINNKNFVQELYPPYPNGQRLNISIIIKDSNFDIPPYIKL